MKCLVGEVDEAVTRLAGLDLSAESDEALAEATLALEAVKTRVDAAHVRMVAAADRRDLHRLDGSPSMSAWLRFRTTLSVTESRRLLNTALRLRRLPTVQAAFAAGKVGSSQVRVICEAAGPRRMDAIAAVQDFLVGVAKDATVTELGRVIERVRDQVDPDGSDLAAEPLIEAADADPRRDFRLIGTIDGLVRPEGMLAPITAHKLRLWLDAYMHPDALDTPIEQLRTAGQRRHDALDAALDDALASGSAPVKGGVKPQVLAVLDLHKLAGEPLVGRSPVKIQGLGELEPHAASALLADASWRMVLMAGPWKVVNVGRAMRRLPAYLRPVLEMLHGHCRGPDCDRPVRWCDADHTNAPWGDGGDTALADSIPCCRTHHTMKTSGGWSVDLDMDTGLCTWTSPQGRQFETRPPPLFN